LPVEIVGWRRWRRDDWFQVWVFFSPQDTWHLPQSDPKNTDRYTDIQRNI